MRSRHARADAKPVVSIIDEAPSALASEAGVTARFAVKAARDTIQPGDGSGTGFGLVSTGSNGDELADLAHPTVEAHDVERWQPDQVLGWGSPLGPVRRNPCRSSRMT